MKKFQFFVFLLALSLILLFTGMPDARAQHFHTSWEGQLPFSPMTIFVIEAKFNGQDMVANDEIGIFDGTQCVGVGIVTGTISQTNLLEIITSKDDGLSGNGFTEGNEIITKIWIAAFNQEYTVSGNELQFYDLVTGDPVDPVPFAGLGTAALGINKTVSQPQHFHTSWEGQQPFAPMNIFVIEAKLDGQELVVNDEIGIFDGEQCVGAGIVTGTISQTDYLEIVASKDDGISGNGFTEGNEIIVKVWITSSGQEYTINSNELQYYNLATGDPVDPVPFTGLGTAAIGINGYSLRDITIVSPNGGEKWQVGVPQTITWNSTNVSGNVKIDISIDNGGSWATINPDIANSGSYSWTPTEIYISDSCLVRISSLANSAISDQSDAVFTIGDVGVDLWIEKEIIAPQDGIITISINCSDVTDFSIYSADLTISYDASVLQAIDVNISGAIAAAANWSTPVKNITDGQIAIGMAGSNPLVGSGVLVNITYGIIGNVDDTSPLHFVSVVFNEGDPLAYTSDGSIKVVNNSNYFDIKGRLGYYYDPTVAIKDAVVQLTGIASKSSISDDNGGYNFLDIESGDYTVTPQKSGDVKDAISSLDASLIMQYAVGSITLTPYQKVAADVSGNGEISSYDASYILRYCVGAITVFPVASDWTFIPHDYPIDDSNWSIAPHSRSYTPLQSDQIDQDFVGILFGDVSGNWAGASTSGSNEIVDLGINEIQQTKDGNWLVPLGIDFSTTAYSGNLKMLFNNHDLKFLSSSSDKSSTNDFIFAVNTCPGGVALAFASSQSLDDHGVAINLLFEKKSHNALSGANFEFMDIVVDEKTGIATRVKNQPNNKLPDDWQLSQNNPNPFNPTTSISFQVPTASHVKIEVFNLLGRRLQTLVDEEKSAGTYNVTWNGRDDQGQSVGSGIYIYKMQAGNFMALKKMILVR